MEVHLLEVHLEVHLLEVHLVVKLVKSNCSKSNAVVCALCFAVQSTPPSMSPCKRAKAHGEGSS